MNRIEACLERCRCENRKALVTYFTVGYPDLAASETAIAAAIDAGADIVELGIPFSDPTADGAVIQAAGQHALNQGVRFADVLQVTASLRRRYPQTPLILFGYYNIFLQFGLEKLLDACYSKVDGLLIVDLPLEERPEVKPLCDARGIALIPLIAPTTGLERARAIVSESKGFVYYITVCGVTGTRGVLPVDLTARLDALKQLTELPVVAGFGVADGAMARLVAAHADGVVVGSALVKVMDQPPEVTKLVRELKAGVAG